jgi:hypothetical protein
MKPLFLTTAALEAGAGFGLLAVPSAFAQLLLAVPLESAAARTVARVGGTGLLALAVAAWFASQDSQSRAARGLAVAMLLYNTGATLILGGAGLQLDSTGIGLWPVVLLHAVMTAWCVTLLFRPSRQD